jgi:hypothetical protein
LGASTVCTGWPCVARDGQATCTPVVTPVVLLGRVMVTPSISLLEAATHRGHVCFVMQIILYCVYVELRMGSMFAILPPGCEISLGHIAAQQLDSWARQDPELISCK